MKLREENLSWQDLEDEIVVLDLAGSTYLKLNGTGATLWRRLAEGADRDDLVVALGQEYDVDNGRLEGDVDAFIARLERADLLDTSP